MIIFARLSGIQALHNISELHLRSNNINNKKPFAMLAHWFKAVRQTMLYCNSFQKLLKSQQHNAQMFLNILFKILEQCSDNSDNISQTSSFSAGQTQRTQNVHVQQYKCHKLTCRLSTVKGRINQRNILRSRLNGVACHSCKSMPKNGRGLFLLICFKSMQKNQNRYTLRFSN